MQMRSPATSPHPSTPPPGSGSGHRSDPGSPTPPSMSFLATKRSINDRVRAMNVNRAKAWAMCMFHPSDGVIVLCEQLIREMMGKDGYFVDGAMVAATKKELFPHKKDGQDRDGALCNAMSYDAYMKDLKVFKLKEYDPAIFADIMAGRIGRAEAWAEAQHIVLKKEQPVKWALKEIEGQLMKAGESDKYIDGADDYAALEEEVVRLLGREHGAKLNATEEKAALMWLVGRKQRTAKAEEEDSEQQEEDAAALREQLAATRAQLVTAQVQLAEALQALQDARGKKRPREGEEEEAGESEGSEDDGSEGQCQQEEGEEEDG